MLSVGFTQAHTQKRCQIALVDLRVSFQQAQYFQVRVLVDGNIFEHWVLFWAGYRSAEGHSCSIVEHILARGSAGLPWMAALRPQ